MARQKWQKKAETSRTAFRGHCVKPLDIKVGLFRALRTGVYARSMDSSRRAMLDSIVPRSKARV